MLTRVWRCCFRLLYNELAWTYDFVSRLVSLGHWRRWQRCALESLPDPADGVILEVAHGTGDLQIDLQRSGYTTAALDLSPYMGRLARRKLQKTGLEANLVRSDALRLPYRSNAFAAAVCTFPASFVIQPLALAELARVLQPSGRAVLVLVGQLKGKGPLPWLIRLLYRLTGQRDAALSSFAVAELFCGARFEVATHIVRFPGSAAQVVVLTSVPALNRQIRD